MDRYFGLFLIVALLFPSGLPRPGKVCASLDPAQPSCCCPAEQNLASADDSAPRLKKSCCCDVRAPEPGKKPTPSLVALGEHDWRGSLLAAAPGATLPLPHLRAHRAKSVATPRGPPDDLFRRYCVIRC
jgi:hypothetical protein